VCSKSAGIGKRNRAVLQLHCFSPVRQRRYRSEIREIPGATECRSTRSTRDPRAGKTTRSDSKALVAEHAEHAECIGI
jgi:hypothetical protein